VTTTASAAGRGLELGRRTATGIVLAIVVFGSIATVPTFTIVVLGITLAARPHDHRVPGILARRGTARLFRT
jgi:hypothetical protein